MPCEKGEGRNYSWMKMYFISVAQLMALQAHMQTLHPQDTSHVPFFQDITEHHGAP